MDSEKKGCLYFWLSLFEGGTRGLDHAGLA